MQHPKDVKGSDKPLPRNDGKFVLDGKRVKFSDYGGSSKETSMSDYDKEVLTALSLLSHVNDWLDHIESAIEDIEYAVAKETLALSKIEERIAIMQEKIDGID